MNREQIPEERLPDPTAITTREVQVTVSSAQRTAGDPVHHVHCVGRGRGKAGIRVLGNHGFPTAHLDAELRDALRHSIREAAGPNVFCHRFWAFWLPPETSDGWQGSFLQLSNLAELFHYWTNADVGDGNKTQAIPADDRDSTAELPRPATLEPSSIEKIKEQGFVCFRIDWEDRLREDAEAILTRWQEADPLDPPGDAP
jgi:hypothetical protein